MTAPLSARIAARIRRALTARPADGTGPILITVDGRWIRQDGTEARDR